MSRSFDPTLAHHAPGGGFRNPWPTADRPRAALVRWAWERARSDLPPNPAPGALPVARSRPARPRAPAGELRATWVGHSTFLLQIGGLNVLTDPHWGARASPLGWAGPRRLVEPGLPFEDLPPVDAVVLSHDHYDHLDEGTVRALVGRFGETVRWLVPLGHRRWLERRGAARVVEMDWWESVEVEAESGRLRISCLPAQHWTNRGFWDREERLWASWAIEADDARAYFGGDSGWFPGYAEIGRRAGPFDLSLLPIGAYDPRWMMKSAHMNPEEAVRAWGELGGGGTFGAMHWGTFRLTDEDPLEPPVRLRRAWEAAGLPEDGLWIPAHGETRVVVGSLDREPEWN